jgi:hypothetical protein
MTRSSSISGRSKEPSSSVPRNRRRPARVRPGEGCAEGPGLPAELRGGSRRLQRSWLGAGRGGAPARTSALRAVLADGAVRGIGPAVIAAPRIRRAIVVTCVERHILECVVVGQDVAARRSVGVNPGVSRRAAVLVALSTLSATRAPTAATRCTPSCRLSRESLCCTTLFGPSSIRMPSSSFVDPFDSARLCATVTPSEVAPTTRMPKALLYVTWLCWITEPGEIALRIPVPRFAPETGFPFLFRCLGRSPLLQASCAHRSAPVNNLAALRRASCRASVGNGREDLTCSPRGQLPFNSWRRETAGDRCSLPFRR